MSKQSDRDHFIALATEAGMPLRVAQAVLSAEKTLHRIAELECSSEAADRDRVPCPAAECPGAECLCLGYGNYDDEHKQHGDVPRIAVREHRLQVKVVLMLKPYNVVPVFNGDPRGSAILLKVPSGKTTDWGQRGIAVP